MITGLPEADTHAFAQRNVCGECGSNLVKCWGGFAGVESYIVRCMASLSHSTYKPKVLNTRKLWNPDLTQKEFNVTTQKPVNETQAILPYTEAGMLKRVDEVRALTPQWAKDMTTGHRHRFVCWLVGIWSNIYQPYAKPSQFRQHARNIERKLEDLTDPGHSAVFSTSEGILERNDKGWAGGDRKVSSASLFSNTSRCKTSNKAVGGLVMAKSIRILTPHTHIVHEFIPIPIWRRRPLSMQALPPTEGTVRYRVEAERLVSVYVVDRNGLTQFTSGERFSHL